MKRSYVLVLLIVLLAAGGTGFLAWQYAQAKESAGANAKKEGTFAVFRIREAPPTIWPNANQKFDREEFERYKRNFLESAKSPLVIAKVLDSAEVRNLPLIKEHGGDAAAWLTDQIVSENTEGSQYVKIGMAGDPKQASKIVNALAKALMSATVDSERAEKLLRRDDLEKKVRAYKQNVLDKQRMLFELNQQIGTADSEMAKIKSRVEAADLEGLMRSRADAQKHIADLTVQIALTKAKIAAAGKGTVSDAQLEEAIAKDPQILEANNELAKLHQQERQIAVRDPTEWSPRLNQAAIEADRAETRAELRIARGKHELEGRADSSSESKKIKAEIDSAEVERKFWSEKSASLRKQAEETARLAIHQEIASIEKSMDDRRNADRQKLIESVQRVADQDTAAMKSLELQRTLYCEQFKRATQDVAMQAENIQKLERFNGDADQLRTDIKQLQAVVNEMSNTLTKWNIELDAPPRVTFDGVEEGDRPAP